MEYRKPIKIDFTMDAALESAAENGEKVFKEIVSFQNFSPCLVISNVDSEQEIPDGNT